jgi:hypothetical protein
MRQARFLLLIPVFLFACQGEQGQSSLSSRTASHSSAPAAKPVFLPDPQQMRPFENYYRIMQDTIETGTMRVNCTREADGWILEEYSTLEVAKIREIIRTKLDTSTLYPIAHEVQGIMAGNQLNISVTWAGDKVKGYSDFPRPPHKRQGHLIIDETVPPYTVERTGTFYTLPFLELKQGYSINFTWYNALYAEVNSINLVVTGTEMVTVPAGTFETWRVALYGGDPTQYVYVNKSQPRRIVKIGVEGLPWSFELI